jgi:hypothetical protein
MTGTALDTKAAVEVAKGAAGILPPAGRAAVFEYLLSGMTQQELKELSPQARETLLQALAGTEAAPSSTRKTSLQTAQEILDSYAFDEKTGAPKSTVPAGVTDVEAMKALNEYFRKNHSELNRDAVYADHLKWFEKLPKEFPDYCEQRDYSQARQITITGVVEGTQGANRTIQGSVLKDDSLVFSDPRDMAIAAAIHACKHNGADLFKALWVRGSVPGFALRTRQDYGVGFCRFNDVVGRFTVAASGSPSPELKKA